MKNIIIFTAIMFMAFTVNAQQNRSRSERSSRSEPAGKEQVKRSARSSQSVNQSRSSVQKSDNNDHWRKSTKETQSRSIKSSEGHGNRTSVRNSSERKNDNSNNRNINRSSSASRPPSAIRESGRQSENYSNERRKDESLDYRSASRSEYKRSTGHLYDVQRRKYTAHHPRRIKRPVTKKYYAYKPIEYRRIHYEYRKPPRHTIIWNISMYHDYVRWYPDFNLWYYPIGYRIHTISAYDARSYIGEVARIYGEIYSTWYSRQTDEYYLYIGGPYPYQDFTIIMEGRDARRFSRRPERFFSGRHIAATGLVSLFEGKPEMFLKKRSQLEVY